MKTLYGVPMKEIIISFEKSKIYGKKYTAIIKNLETGRVHRIHFGGDGYEQFEDSTPNKLYSNVDHGDIKRRENYFSRHSGVKTKREAVIKELHKSLGHYNAKILSHIYLW